MAGRIFITTNDARIRASRLDAVEAELEDALIERYRLLVSDLPLEGILLGALLREIRALEEAGFILLGDRFSPSGIYERATPPSFSAPAPRLIDASAVLHPRFLTTPTATADPHSPAQADGRWAGTSLRGWLHNPERTYYATFDDWVAAQTWKPYDPLDGGEAGYPAPTSSATDGGSTGTPSQRDGRRAGTSDGSWAGVSSDPKPPADGRWAGTSVTISGRNRGTSPMEGRQAHRGDGGEAGTPSMEGRQARPTDGAKAGYPATPGPKSSAIDGGSTGPSWKQGRDGGEAGTPLQQSGPYPTDRWNTPAQDTRAFGRRLARHLAQRRDRHE